MRRLRAEHGQTTVEWLGIAAVVVAVVVALIAASGDTGRTIQTAYEGVVCRVTGGDCAGGDTTAGGVTNADPATDNGEQSSDEQDNTEEHDDGGGLLDTVGDIAGGIVGGGAAVIKGFVLGDAGDPYTNPWMEGLRQGGHIASGILVVGDIRDAGVAGHSIITTGDGWGDLGMSVIGLVPVIGDGAKAVKGADRVADAARSADNIADAGDTAVDAGRAADGASDAGRGADEAARGADDAATGRVADRDLTPEELAVRNADRARRASSNSGDARILEDNMTTIDGIPKPPGHEAHHIVPPRHRSGEGVREILDDLDVPVNHEANGAYLPGPQIDPGDASPHRRVHTNRYYEELEDRLGRATTTEEATEILRQAGEDLANGTFPY